MSMKIVIAGGTGFIGTYLKKRFEAQGDLVLVVSRQPQHVSWNLNELIGVLENSDVLINLSGRNINCRYTEKNKQQILDSRLNTTKYLQEVVDKCKNPPHIWVNASASAIYASCDNPATEFSENFANDFLGQVVKRWENLFFTVEMTRTRRIALRTAVVLGRDGGALTPLFTLARAGLGGKAGSGKQMFSWIHIEDYFRVIQYCIENEQLHGVVNCTSPEPVTNKEFMKSLRNTTGIPFGLAAPAFLVRLGARFIGTEPDLILNSSNFVPEVLLKSGFEFKYPRIDMAFRDLLKK